MKVKFRCLASGSSGNCYYLGTGTCGILIDAGIGSRTLRKALKQFELPIENIRAIFITHDHSDHIKGVGYLGDKLHIPVYATALTHAGIDRNYHTGDKLSAASVRHIEKGVPIKIDCFCIECFEVPHDGTDNVGYCIETDGKRVANNIHMHLEAVRYHKEYRTERNQHKSNQNDIRCD